MIEEMLRLNEKSFTYTDTDSKEVYVVMPHGEHTSVARFTPGEEVKIYNVDSDRLFLMGLEVLYV